MVWHPDKCMVGAKGVPSQITATTLTIGLQSGSILLLYAASLKALCWPALDALHPQQPGAKETFLELKQVSHRCCNASYAHAQCTTQRPITLLVCLTALPHSPGVVWRGEVYAPKRWSPSPSPQTLAVSVCCRRMRPCLMTRHVSSTTRSCARRGACTPPLRSPLAPAAGRRWIGPRPVRPQGCAAAAARAAPRAVRVRRRARLAPGPPAQPAAPHGVRPVLHRRALRRAGPTAQEAPPAARPGRLHPGPLQATTLRCSPDSAALRPPAAPPATSARPALRSAPATAASLAVRPPRSPTARAPTQPQPHHLLPVPPPPAAGRSPRETLPRGPVSSAGQVGCAGGQSCGRPDQQRTGLLCNARGPLGTPLALTKSHHFAHTRFRGLELERLHAALMSKSTLRSHL